MCIVKFRFNGSLVRVCIVKFRFNGSLVRVCVLLSLDLMEALFVYVLLRSIFNGSLVRVCIAMFFIVQLLTTNGV